MSLLMALSLTGLCGCLATQPTSPAPGISADPPPNAVVHKAAEGPKRPPLPGTVVALAYIKEREGDKAKEIQEMPQMMKLYDEARQRYQEALRIDPNYRDAIQGLARVYTRLEDYARAQEVYQKALEKNPKDHGMWYDMGSCYCRKKELDRALSCFQKALELDPENRAYMKTLGFTLARMGQSERGLELLTRAMGTALAHYNMARMMEHLGQPDACRRHLELALQINPNLAQARDMLALGDTPRPVLQFSE
jgi:tetratricopeptide (TPR) repeat protein